VSVGQLVAAGQAVGRLIASDAVEVRVSLADADAALIPGIWGLRAGAADAGVPALVVAQHGNGSYAWDGHVDRAEASVDAETRTLDIVVRVPNPLVAGRLHSGDAAAGGDPPLLVGEFVDVEIAGVLREFFRAPRAALRPGNEIWTVDEDGRVRVTQVEVLQRAKDEVMVAGALSSGTVVTGGLDFATNGMRVLTEASR